LLVETLRRGGVDAVGYKPVACGDREDAVVLAEASGGLSLDEVNPVFMPSPVAPYVAGLLENRTVDMAVLVAGYEHLAARHDVVVVEGAGGWEVPLAPMLRMSDLAVKLGLPVLVVAGNRLGVLNHTLLTAAAVAAKGMPCVGVILNQLSDELDTAMITNKGVMEDVTGVPLLDHVIHGQEFLDEDWLVRLGLLSQG
jgi:dethiobiotin synthetase